MSTVNYNVNVNTTQGVQALNNLQTKLGGVNSAFGILKNAIGGLAIGAAVKSVIAFADQIQDLSDATGIAIENIVGFGKALDAFGGNAETANKAILRLTTNIGEAASGSAGLQDAFAQVGVTLQDLKVLSEQDLLAKTIQGIEGISDKSEQALLKQKLLGKEFRGISTSGLSEAYATATEKSAKYAESIRQAAELQGKFDQALGTAKLALLGALEPLLNFINALDDGKINRTVDAVSRLGQVLLVLYGLGKVTTLLTGFSAAATGAAAAVGGAALAIAKFVIWPIRIIAALAAVNEAIKIAFDFDPVGKFIEYVKEAYSVVKGLLPEFLKFNETAGSGRGGNPELTKQLQEQGEALRKQSEALKEQPNAIREVVDAFAKQRIAIQGASDEFNKSNKKILDNINLENSLIGKTKEYQDVVKAQEEIFKRAADETDKLRDAKEKLSAEEKRAGLGKEYDIQIEKIQKLAEQDANRVKAAVENTQRIQNNEQLRLYTIQAFIDLQNKANELTAQSTTMLLPLQAKGYAEIEIAARNAAKAKIEAEEVRRGEKLSPEEQTKYYEAARQGIESVKAAQDQLNVTTEKYNLIQYGLRNQYDLQRKIADVQHEMNTSTMSGIAKKYADIEKAARDSADAQIQAEELRTGKKLDETSRKAYYDEARKGIEGLKTAEEQAWNTSRDGLTGLKKALNEYVDDATNAAKTVENVFKKATQGMEDMIVNFAKTGKLEWKGFVASMLEELLRSQLRQTMASLFSLGGNQVKGGGGGIFGGSIIPGILAEGGPVSDRRPYLVGERGPELFVPNSAGSMIPNSGLSGGGNVTYNISAVDAMSFKQMIAKDPGFIHAIATQGSKYTPARR